MMRPELIEWVRGSHKLEPDRFLFTMCYSNPEAILYIVDDKYVDDGVILPVYISEIVQAETGIQTLYRIFLEDSVMPDCFRGTPEFIYYEGKAEG